MKTAILILAMSLACAAQTDQVQVPHVIRYTGSATVGATDMTFAIYAASDSTIPLWAETQSITTNGSGHYTVLLGSTKPEGLPADIFTSGDARWLGVRAGDQPESPRVLLVSVPYALKAADADTLGGRPLSDFVLSDTAAPASSSADASTSAMVLPKRLSATSKLSTTPRPKAVGDSGTGNHLAKFAVDGFTLGNSGIVEVNGNLGVGTTTPRFPIELVASNVEFLQRNPDPNSYSGMRFYNDQNSATRALEIDYSGSTFPSVNVFNGPVGESASIATTGAFPLTLGTNNTARVTISSTGNFGVGTTTPRFPIELVGSNVEFLQRNPDPNSYSGMRFYNDQNTALRALEIDYSGSTFPGVNVLSGPTGESASIATTGPFPLTLGSNNTMHITISGAGNVGINTPTPTATLDVNGFVRTTVGYKFGDGSTTDTRYVQVAPQGFTYATSSLTGTYAFSSLGIQPVSAQLIRVFSNVGTVTFDAAGHVTAGSMTSFTSGGSCNSTITGTYTVAAGGTGTASLTFTVTSGSCQTTTSTFNLMVTQQGSSFEFAQNDNVSWNSGQGHRQ